MISRLEIVSKLVEDKHITFEEGLMLMEEVKHPLNNFPRHIAPTGSPTPPYQGGVAIPNIYN